MPVYFENPHFRAAYEHLSEDRLVVGFGGLGSVKRQHIYWGQSFFQAAGFSYIALTPKTPHWWFDGCLGDAHLRISEICSRYPNVVLYGHSMGAHGCFVHGDALNATAILASSPQFSIDATVIGRFDRSLSGYFRRDYHTDMGNKTRTQVHATVIVDPADRIDIWHCRQLQKINPQIQRLVVPFTSHDPLQFMRETGCLSQVIATLLNNPAAIPIAREIIRERRRHSPLYSDRLAKIAAWRSMRSLRAPVCHSTT